MNTQHNSIVYANNLQFYIPCNNNEDISMIIGVTIEDLLPFCVAYNFTVNNSYSEKSVPYYSESFSFSCDVVDISFAEKLAEVIKHIFIAGYDKTDSKDVTFTLQSFMNKINNVETKKLIDKFLKKHGGGEYTDNDMHEFFSLNSVNTNKQTRTALRYHKNTFKQFSEKYITKDNYMYFLFPELNKKNKHETFFVISLYNYVNDKVIIQDAHMLYSMHCTTFYNNKNGDINVLTLKDFMNNKNYLEQSDIYEYYILGIDYFDVINTLYVYHKNIKNLHDVSIQKIHNIFINKHHLYYNENDIIDPNNNIFKINSIMITEMLNDAHKVVKNMNDVEYFYNIFKSKITSDVTDNMSKDVYDALRCVINSKSYTSIYKFYIKSIVEADVINAKDAVNISEGLAWSLDMDDIPIFVKNILLDTVSCSTLTNLIKESDNATDILISAEQWLAYVNNYDEYKDMPLSWWAELA